MRSFREDDVLQLRNRGFQGEAMRVRKPGTTAPMRAGYFPLRRNRRTREILMVRTLIGVAVVACWMAAPAPVLAACGAQSDGHVVPLIELYTAEGCNECPAADRWLSALARRTQPSQLSLLALHVDYWDSIGWPDRFADPLHSRRQEARVLLDGKQVVYTPQVMIGQDTRVDWRDSRRLDDRLRRTREQPAQVALTMQLEAQAGSLRVAYRAHLDPAAAGLRSQTQPLLWLALYQDGLSSAVSAGENKGLTLRHDKVVRSLQGPWPLGSGETAGKATIVLPVQATPANTGLVLFAESGTSGAGLQSLHLPLSSCGF